MELFLGVGLLVVGWLMGVGLIGVGLGYLHLMFYVLLIICQWEGWLQSDEANHGESLFVLIG